MNTPKDYTRYAEYTTARQNAEKKISALLKKYAIRHKHGSIVDKGKPIMLLPRDIQKQIDKIRAEIELLKFWKT